MNTTAGTDADGEHAGPEENELPRDDTDQVRRDRDPAATDADTGDGTDTGARTGPAGGADAVTPDLDDLGAPDPALPLISPLRSTSWTRAVVWMGVFVVVVTLPLWVGRDISTFFVDALVLVAVAQWWGLLAGHCGVVSLAAGLFAGTGAYAWLVLTADLGANPVLAVAVAAIGSVAVGLGSGWVLLRLPPGWSALGGLVLTATVRDLIGRLDETAATAGRSAAYVVELDPTLRRGLTTWLAVVVGVGSVAAVAGLRRSRIGVMAVAHRDDAEAAATLGIRGDRLQLTLWVGMAAAVGMAGAVVHLRTGTVQLDEAFDPLRWVVPALVAASLGGMRTIAGPVVGSLIYLVAERLFGAPVALILCGLAAAVLMVWLPRGLATVAVPAARRFWREHVAQRVDWPMSPPR